MRDTSVSGVARRDVDTQQGFGGASGQSQSQMISIRNDRQTEELERDFEQAQEQSGAGPMGCA